jgi:hypothetical protein
MRIFWVIAAAVVGGLTGASALWLFQGNSLALVPEKMTYAELCAVMLSAVSVLVTILGVVVAIIAFWGYAHFKGIAETTARDHVNEQMAKGTLREELETSVTRFMQHEFGDTGKLRALLEARVDQIIVSGPSQREREEASQEGDEDVEL